VAKARSVYFCSGCGFESPRWLGRCPQCDAWNSFDERPMRVVASRAAASAPLRADSGPVLLRDVDEARLQRIRTGSNEFDAVLGGGIVPGSLTLVGGPPGAGKSTLLLQIAARLSGNVVYVCGEESAAQVKMRAQRLALGSAALRHGEPIEPFDTIRLFPETNLRTVLDHLEKTSPRALVIDSIQTVWLPESESYAGSVTQVRDCTQALMEFSKRTGCAAFIVGHVTKEGAIAGPRLLEHLVDTVLYFEGEASGDYRILRAYKNRFGSVDEICVFAMHGDGLHEVPNPSEVFLSNTLSEGRARAGSCVAVSIVGSRPVLVEVQALVGESSYGTPRRLANNIDQARLAMIIAVLERRAGLQLGMHDVYASVAGGLRINEPAADLAVALAIASSFRNRALAPDAGAFGELGLSGEIRAVNAAARRVAEANKLGYRTLYTPQNCADVAQAIDLALP
jgi:DNA repair protein RadA/Sms